MVAIVVMLSGVIAGFILTFDDELNDPNLEPNQGEGEDGDEEGLNPWSDDGLFAPEDPAAGEDDVRYRLQFDIQSSDSVSEDSEELGNIDVIVSTGDDMFTDVAEADFERLEIDGVDQNLDPSDVTWAADSGGSELNIEFDGYNYDPSAGEEVTLIFGGVDNPDSSGTYNVDAELNGDDQKTGELEIVDDTESLRANERPVSTLD